LAALKDLKEDDDDQAREEERNVTCKFSQDLTLFEHSKSVKGQHSSTPQNLLDRGLNGFETNLRNPYQSASSG
jgi:hypothetical protein